MELRWEGEYGDITKVFYDTKTKSYYANYKVSGLRPIMNKLANKILNK